MLSPARELQKAVYARLAADGALTALLGGAHVYDRAPAETPFPYLTFGRTSVFDWSTGTESGTEQLFTLHAWSKAQSRKEALDILDRVGALLTDASLTLQGHALITMRMDFLEVRFDEDLALHHGLIRFRALTEAVPA